MPRRTCSARPSKRPSDATSSADARRVTTVRSRRRREQHALDDLRGRDAGGLGGEAHHQTMAKRGDRDLVDVVVGDVRAAVEERHDLRAEHQRLRAARARAVGDVAPDVDLGLAVAARAGGRRETHEPGDVLLDVRRDQHLAHEPLQLLGACRGALGREHGPHGRRIGDGGRRRGCASSSASLGYSSSTLKRKRSSCASGSW